MGRVIFDRSYKAGDIAKWSEELMRELKIHEENNLELMIKEYFEKWQRGCDAWTREMSKNCKP